MTSYIKYLINNDIDILLHKQLPTESNAINYYKAYL